MNYHCLAFLTSYFPFINSSEIKNQKKHVVVIGNGWAGHTFVRNLDRNKYQVSVISPNSIMNDPTILISELEYELYKKFNPVQNNQTNFDVLNYYDLKKYVDLIHYPGYCINFDLLKSTIKFKSNVLKQGNIDILKYDYLVVATGATNNTYGIPGVQDYCLTFRSKDDLEKLLQKITNKTKNLPSCMLRIIIIGTGPTGIELASVLSKYFQIELLEASPKFLPSSNNSTSKKIYQEFQRHGISVSLSTMVRQITNSKIKIRDLKQVLNVNSYTEIPYNANNTILIWTAGVKPNLDNMVYTINHDSKPLNQITKPDLFLISESLSKVYLIGDANKAYVPTAQMAFQQGRYLAHLLNTDQWFPFTYYDYGKLIHSIDKIYYESGGISIGLPKWMGGPIKWVTNKN